VCESTRRRERTGTKHVLELTDDLPFSCDPCGGPCGKCGGSVVGEHPARASPYELRWGEARDGVVS